MSVGCSNIDYRKLSPSGDTCISTKGAWYIAPNPSWKTWLLEQFSYLFTPLDLTRYDYMACENCVIMSGQVRRCKNNSKTAGGAMQVFQLPQPQHPPISLKHFRLLHSSQSIQFHNFSKLQKDVPWN